MLASSEGGDGQGSVQVWPGSDDDGIYVWVVYQFPPIASRLHFKAQDIVPI